MEQATEKRSMSSTAIMNGIVLGVALIAISFLFYMISSDLVKYGNWLGYIVHIGLLVYAMIQFKNAQEGRLISYGRTFKLGFLMSLYAGILVAVYTFIQFTVIAPEELANAVLIAEDAILETNPNMSDEQFDMAMKISTWMLTPTMMTIMTLVGVLIRGTIFSLIIAAFVKSDNSKMVVEA